MSGKPSLCRESGIAGITGAAAQPSPNLIRIHAQIAKKMSAWRNFWGQKIQTLITKITSVNNPYFRRVISLDSSLTRISTSVAACAQEIRFIILGRDSLMRRKNVTRSKRAMKMRPWINYGEEERRNKPCRNSFFPQNSDLPRVGGTRLMLITERNISVVFTKPLIRKPNLTHRRSHDESDVASALNSAEFKTKVLTSNNLNIWTENNC